MQGSVIQYWSLVHDEKLDLLVKGNLRLTAITGEKDISNGLEWATVAIVSGGNISHEVLGAQVPTIIVPLTDNQYESTRYYSKRFNVPVVETVNNMWDKVDWSHNLELAIRSQKQMKMAKQRTGSLANDLLKLRKSMGKLPSSSKL